MDELQKLYYELGLETGRLAEAIDDLTLQKEMVRMQREGLSLLRQNIAEIRQKIKKLKEGKKWN